MNWIDNRIKIEPNNKNSGHVLRSPETNSVAVALQDKKILDHIWIPGVYIPHRGLSRCRHGDGFYDEVLNFLVKNESVWVDYWMLLKPTITCSMVFNWFPFDEQNCSFTIQVEQLVWINTCELEQLMKLDGKFFREAPI